MITMETLHPQYLKTPNGIPSFVVLPIEEYEQLIEDYNDLTIIKERREETKSVEKDFNKISKEKHEYLLNAIESLSLNPFPISQYKKLKGTMNSYRLRVGDYRILYEVEDVIKIITVYRVRHRKEVYKK